MKEIAKSIRQRLLNFAKKNQVDYNVVLIRFFHERFLYRLSISSYRNNFYLKGGTLLYAVETKFPRPTLDIDLAGIKIKNDRENLLNIFTEICAIEFLEDGVAFDLSSIKTDDINVSKKYPGIRVSFIAHLDTIRQQIQIDIGFGDRVDKQVISYPKLIETLPGAVICAYSSEYIVAEKFHAMIFLSELNSRYKDFYDVYVILKKQLFDNKKLTEAVKQTFQTRNTSFEANHPLFSDAFVKDRNRILQWKNFLRKINAPDLEFSTVMKCIVERLSPIYSGLSGDYQLDMNSSPRIVFMGTPEFAVESLRRLVENGYNVVGVVTMPDKPAGKHHSVLQASPVKEYALSQNLPLLQPEKLKDPDFLEQLSAWNADLQIVVAFRMLPEAVWNMPHLGTFNLHASLLPQYRGAAPIQWAIINGEKETGVTTFFLTHTIDTGKIIAQERIPIEPADTAGIVHDRLMHLGAQLVIKTVDLIINDQINPIDQKTLGVDASDLKPAPKISNETGAIDWNKTTEDIYNLIRGLSPYPGAWTVLTTNSGEPLQCKIFESEKIIQPHRLSHGTIDFADKNQLKIATSDGFIQVKSIQQAGKKRMAIEDFLRGKTL
jgi:methionyl-tRNA formyltransferase